MQTPDVAAIASEPSAETREHRRPGRRSVVNSVSPAPVRQTDVGGIWEGEQSRRAWAETERRRLAETALPTPKGPLVVPAEIAERFVEFAPGKFAFQNGALAFEVRDRKLTTRSENAELARTMVAIQRENGENALVVTGTHRFRREVWRAATAAGMAVQGYVPTQVERAQLARRTGVNSVEATPAAEPRLPSPTGTLREFNRPELPPTGEMFVQGALVSHGPHRRADSPGPPDSYYVTVDTPEGRRTFSDPDLQRAFATSRTQPQSSNTIGVRSIPRDRLLDGERAPERYWVVEKAEFFKARRAAAETLRDPDISSSEAAAKYPDLKGVYAFLKLGAQAAERLSREENRDLFLRELRERLAQHIERGETIPQAPARHATRRQTPTREGPEILR